ncbi:MAG: hypothetical protein J6O40_05955 [Ruminococcus sp.]|nr:hypothetical protein [Ruminococcus sp.]
MYESLDKLIKDLPHELKEKAEKCKDFEELSELFADNDIEIPEDKLEAVSGGAQCDGQIHEKPPCPNCGSYLSMQYASGELHCCNCCLDFDPIEDVKPAKDTNKNNFRRARL